MKDFFLKNFYSLADFEFLKGIDEETTPWECLYLLKDFFASCKQYKIEIDIPPFVYLKNPDQISIGKNTIIEPGAYIEGPCIIKENCEIRHGAYIRPFVYVAEGSVIGHATEVKHSILLPSSKAAHFAYVGDSILGRNVNLGAGVKCANFRLDKKYISFLIDGKRIETNLLKMGAIIGDNAQIGCNVVLNPATFIGRNTICYSSLSLHGMIPTNAIIKDQTKILIRQKRKQHALA